MDKLASLAAAARGFTDARSVTVTRIGDRVAVTSDDGGEWAGPWQVWDHAVFSADRPLSAGEKAAMERRQSALVALERLVSAVYDAAETRGFVPIPKDFFSMAATEPRPRLMVQSITPDRSTDTVTVRIYRDELWMRFSVSSIEEAREALDRVAGYGETLSEIARTLPWGAYEKT